MSFHQQTSRTLTKCPYTLRPLTELEKISREHIILDSLGGPNGYSVQACEAQNNNLGRTIDAQFANDPLVGFFRMSAGVESRSGEAKWKLDGQTTETQRPVQIIFSKDKVNIYHKKPVEKFVSEKGAGYKIVAHEPQSSEQLKKIEKDMLKKGQSISHIEYGSEVDSNARFKIAIDLNVIEAGLMKIAYLAACEYLGDQFLADPLVPEWQKAIRGGDVEFWKTIQIFRRVNPDTSVRPCSMLLPSLGQHEHGIMIANLNDIGPIMMVQLFGSPLLSLYVRVSDSSNFDLDEAEGKLVIVDSESGQCTQEPWSNHLIRMAGETP